MLVILLCWNLDRHVSAFFSSSEALEIVAQIVFLRNTLVLLKCLFLLCENNNCMWRRQNCGIMPTVHSLWLQFSYLVVLVFLSCDENCPIAMTGNIFAIILVGRGSCLATRMVLLQYCCGCRKYFCNYSCGSWLAASFSAFEKLSGRQPLKMTMMMILMTTMMILMIFMMMRMMSGRQPLKHSFQFNQSI